ncbi:MAG: MoaD/ThiS family protein [Actinobacteria bacterium]|nr:MoaD/ThiS family protein [Actinomycetota bacterium]
MSGPHTPVRVRLFAAAAHAAGADEFTVTAPTLADVLAVVTELAAEPERFSSVLSRCSVLVDGAQAPEDSVPLPAGACVDVLPPFAGG